MAKYMTVVCEPITLVVDYFECCVVDGESHHGESSSTSSYSFDDFNPTQYNTQTSYPDQPQYSSFNLPTPPHIVNYPQTNYTPQWPNSQTNTIESLATGFNDDDFVNEIWTNSASQVQNEVTMELMMMLKFLTMMWNRKSMRKRKSKTNDPYEIKKINYVSREVIVYIGVIGCRGESSFYFYFL